MASYFIQLNLNFLTFVYIECIRNIPKNVENNMVLCFIRPNITFLNSVDYIWAHKKFGKNDMAMYNFYGHYSAQEIWKNKWYGVVFYLAYPNLLNFYALHWAHKKYSTTKWGNVLFNLT